jgi:hypothetical protein
VVTARIRYSDGLPNARSPETSPRTPDLLGHNRDQDEAGLISGERSPLQQLPLVGHCAPEWEPEPLPLAGRALRPTGAGADRRAGNRHRSTPSGRFWGDTKKWWCPSQLTSQQRGDHR